MGCTTNVSINVLCCFLLFFGGGGGGAYHPWSITSREWVKPVPTTVLH